MNKKKILYVLECDNENFFKIGVTNSEESLIKRIKTLQTGNPFKINVKFSQFHDDALGAEKYLHSVFQKNRVMGEWFGGLTFDEIRVKLMLYHF